MQNKQPFGISVALFRIRALRLFHQWAYHYTVRVNKDLHVSREHSRTICITILTRYWSQVRRNPLLTEWARDYLFYLEHGIYLPCPGEPSAVMNIQSPFWSMLLHAKDEERALQTFSLRVGAAFLIAARKTGTFDYELDWTQEETITNFLSSLNKVPFWKKWWDRFLKR